MNKKGIIVILSIVLFCLLSYINFNSDNHYVSYKTKNVYQSNNGNTSVNNGKIDFNTTLNKPGENYVFEFSSKNDSDYDMYLEDYSKIIYENGRVLNKLPKYLKYTVVDENGNEVKTGEILKSHSVNKYRVKLEYRKDINPEDLPTEDHNYSFSIKMNFIQR